MLDQSSDFQNKLRAKTVTKDFCSQNNQLYICVLSIIQRPDSIVGQRYKVINIKRLLTSFHGQKPPYCRTSDSWPSPPLWKISRSTPPLFLDDVQKRSKSPIPAALSLVKQKSPCKCPAMSRPGGAGVYIDWCINLPLSTPPKSILIF